jgi:formylglycine-generating enzyme required for sulfatase activity
MTNSIGMKFVLIPPGEFLMGSPESEEGSGEDEHQHRVRITKPFCLGACEVAQDAFDRVTGANPSAFSPNGQHKDRVSSVDTKRLPVEFVSWEEAAEFCRRLSAFSGERAREREYRLPTEAEWEYAHRAGAQTRCCFGDDLARLSEFAWYGAMLLRAFSTSIVGDLLDTLFTEERQISYTNEKLTRTVERGMGHGILGTYSVSAEQR